MEQLKKLAMHEILTQTAQIKDREKQIEFLRLHGSEHLHEARAFSYDERVHWLLPATNPPYTPLTDNDDEYTSMSFHRECCLGKLYYFVHGGKGANINSSQRENTFIQLSETIDAREAELLLTLKNKKLPDGITKELIEEAYGVMS